VAQAYAVEGAGTHIPPIQPPHRQEEPTLIINSQTRQRMSRLIENGLQFYRAATRVASDTPMSMMRSRPVTILTNLIQHGMARLLGSGVHYSRAASMVVTGDRLPCCMTVPNPDEWEAEPAQDPTRVQDPEGINIWPLSVRGISTKERLEEHERRAGERGILLLQETWRPTSSERLQIGEWIYYGTGRTDTPRGNGTGIMVHKSIAVKSWHHISCQNPTDDSS
jgi:hypothetical protein